jgi:hypothetical protein
MNSILSRNIIELLDRKYSFVQSTTHDLFPLDFEQFIHFLQENELIKPFVEKLFRDVKEHLERYKAKMEIEMSKAVEIRDMLIKRHPKMNDSNMKRPQGVIDTEQYDFSFANFNELLNGTSKEFGYSFISGLYRDESPVAGLIWIPRMKVNNYLGLNPQPKRKITKEIHYKLEDLESLHKHTHREWIDYQRVAPGRALVELIDIAKNINPEPEDWTDFRKMSTLEKLNYAAAQFYTKPNYSTIRAIVYGNSEERPLLRTTDEERIALIEKIRTLLKRAYEGIRQEIGTTQVYLQLMNRYRLRSQWYNYAHLRKLVETRGGIYQRNREDLLTKDLALYLFDNGITILYRTRFGKHEVDLLEIDVEDPIFIEAKAYKDSSATRELIDGIAQLHSYLSNLEGYKPIREAYYVVYRLAGPIYEFPEMIGTNRFQIFPILVDLGLSAESGRKQPEPILISKEDVLSQIEKASSPNRVKKKR